MINFLIENIELLLFWLVVIIALGSIAGVIFFVRATRKLWVMVDEIRKLRAEVNVRVQPEKGTYEDRLKKEYEKRGLDWSRYHGSG